MALSKSSKSRSRFKYHERTEEDVKRRAEQKGGTFDSIFKSGVDRWRPKDGENAIRILPPTWDDHEHYGFDIYVHSFVGPDKSTYLCLQKMQNKPCPICKAEREAKNAGEEDEAKELRVTKRVVVWVVDRDDEKSTPSLFDMSWSMDRDIAALCHDKKRGRVLLIDHPEEGYDVSFTKTGKGLNTRYIGMAIERESSPIMADEDDQEKILEYIQENPIPDLLAFKDEEFLANMISGESSEKDDELDDEDEDDKPRSRKASKKGRREDDDGDGEDEDDGEGDRRVRRSSRSASRKEEEDDGDDEADADEERPRRPSRSGRRQEEEEPDDEDGSEDDGEADSEQPRGRDRRRRDEDEDEDDEAPKPRGKSSRSRDEDEDEDEGDEEDDRSVRRSAKPGRESRRGR